MKKSKIDWINFHTACFHTARKILEDGRQIDTIIALARGGLVPARIIAEYTEPVNFYTIGLKLYNGSKRGEQVTVYQDMPDNTNWLMLGNILIVDDISDGGSTFDFVYKKITGLVPEETVFTAAPYIKPGTKFVPDYYVTEFPNDTWVVFPFEKYED